MKRLATLPLILLFAVLVLNSCEEDEYADWKILNENWLAVHKSDPGFIETSSGLCYKVIHPGATKRPNSTSYISVEYVGTYINGVVFDATDEGEVLETNLSSTIQGWTEGVSKMKVGGHFIFYVPASLAYGDEGFGSIPPYSVLIFDITLVESEDQL